MRWQGRRGSENVVDQTGNSSSGGRRRVGLLGGGGIGTVVIAVILLFFGVSPTEIFGFLSSSNRGAVSGTTRSAQPDDPVTAERKEFVKVVLADTEEVWGEIFTQNGATYREPNLILYSGSVDSACGFSGPASGPFYCPGDQNLYLDLTFFDQLAQDLGAPGDFAQAYVIGHEVGHHVQNLTGVLNQVRGQKAKLSEADANALQVKVELQADYYAGVWANHAQRRFNILEPGDIEEALRAASSIGDDTLQRRSKGYVVPDAFTHGTSEQRVRWFRKGFEQGEIKGGDTFSASSL